MNLDDQQTLRRLSSHDQAKPTKGQTLERSSLRQLARGTQPQNKLRQESWLALYHFWQDWQERQ